MFRLTTQRKIPRKPGRSCGFDTELHMRKREKTGLQPTVDAPVPTVKANHKVQKGNKRNCIYKASLLVGPVRE